MKEVTFVVKQVEFVMKKVEFAVRESEFAVRESEFALKQSEFAIAVREVEFAVTLLGHRKLYITPIVYRTIAEACQLTKPALLFEVTLIPLNSKSMAAAH